MEQILHMLGIEPKAILVQIAGFLVLLWLLKRFLFGPVSNMMDARQAEIQSTLNKLEEDRNAIEAEKAELQKRLDSIQREAQERIREALKEAQQMKDEILAEARSQAERIVENGRLEVQRERDKALVVLREQVAELAVESAGKILGRVLDDDIHRRLVAEFISAVPQALEDRSSPGNGREA